MKEIFILVLLCMDCIFCSNLTWDTWWTYEGISGPDFWGLINPKWQLCTKGKRQSPININMDKLLFDPNLEELKIGNQKVNGLLQNTGRSLEFKTTDSNNVVVFSGGPLSYNYQFEGINIHYGLQDPVGSEHQINGKYFSGEIQLYAYNKDLYQNLSEARENPQGMVMISVMVKIGNMTSQSELRVLTSALTKIAYGGSSHLITNISINALLPDTKEYFTYEGSFTQPGCWETVVWIIYNRPIYMTVQEMYAIRRLMQGTPDNRKDSLGNNIRKIRPSLVTVRTNIQPKSGTRLDSCSTTYTDTKPDYEADDIIVAKSNI